MIEYEALPSTEALEIQVERSREYTFENVTHGPLIQDRKSVFQGHACKVTTQQGVKYVCYYRWEFSSLLSQSH